MKAAGVTVISVSLDDKRQAWLSAQAKDGITWVSLWDKNGFQNRAVPDPYKVRAFPTSYLIAPDGTIVLEESSAEKVLQYLTKHK